MRVKIIDFKHIMTVDHKYSTYIELFKQEDEYVTNPNVLNHNVQAQKIERVIYNIKEFHRMRDGIKLTECYAICQDQVLGEIPFLEEIIKDKTIKLDQKNKQLETDICIYKKIESVFLSNFILKFIYFRILKKVKKSM